jgi:ubiquitin-protein ligase
MWYEQQQWGSRLQLEIEVMRRRFPGFVLQRDADRSLYWEGILEPLRGVAYLVRIRYPARYPYAEPTLWLVEPPLVLGTPHTYRGGSICVHRRYWNPETGTAASLAPLLSAWLLLYSVFLATGERW